MLRNGGEDVNREPVRLREVHGYEVHPALHQVGDEGDVAGQPIELGDHQRGVVQPAQRERLRELGPVRSSQPLNINHDVRCYKREQAG
jgi:hypothetical protein